MRFQRLLRHYSFGLLMGGADVVPGVSGGTMALIVGIYARLIDSIGRAVAVIPLAARGRPGAAVQSLLTVDWMLVLPLGAGIVTAIGVGSAVIPGLMDEHPVLMRALFFGLIAGSITLPWRRIEERTTRTMAVLAVAAVAAFLFSGLPDLEVSDPPLIRIFGSAALAICAMILPGVSGAFLLLVLGLYEPTLDAVRDRDLVYLATFLAGAAFGISLFATGLRWLLVHARDITMAALVGLMAGSLRALWPFLEEDRSLRGPVEGEPVVAAAALALGGLVAVLVLARIGERTEAAESARGASAR